MPDSREIEAVARAIADADGSEAWGAYTDMARAALDRVRADSAQCPDCAYGQQEDESGMLYRCSTCGGTGRADSARGEDHEAWRCTDCNCVNRMHEAFCFLCGAGQPEYPARPSPVDDTERLREALREAIGWTYGDGECTPERRAELEALLSVDAGKPDR